MSTLVLRQEGKYFWCAIAGVLLLVTVGGRHLSVEAGEAKFAEAPKVSRDGEKTLLSFALSAPGDVEVAVLNAKGVPVRHLAAGVLGGPKPPPEPLLAGLSQKLSWDGLDDQGKAAADGPFQFRVRLGMGVKFGRTLTDSPYYIGTVQGLASGDDGNLYVFHQTLQTGPQSVQVFDDRGEYVRTAFPFPADLPRAKLGDLVRWDAAEKRIVLRNYHDTYPRQFPYSMKAGESVEMVPQVTRECGILVFAPQWIFRLDPDGSTGERSLRYSRFFPFGISRYDAATEEIFTALAAQSRTLYAGGPCTRLDGDGKPFNESWPAGQLFSMKVDSSDYLKPFARLELPADWPSKARPPVAGLATDAKGRVYACVRTTGKVVVLEADGKPVGSLAAVNPYRVAIHPENGSLYVLSREDLTREEMTKKGKVTIRTYRYRLARYENLQAERPAAQVEFPESSSRNASLALTVKDGRTGVWLAELKSGGGRQDRADLTRFEEKEGSFAPTAALHERDPDTLGQHDTLAVDPFTEEVYINNDYSIMYRFNGLTGEGGPLRKIRPDFYSTEVAVGRDGLIYARTGDSYSGPLERLTRELKPAPLASGTHLFTDYIYSRYGAGYAEKGVAVGPQGQVYVMNMYDWQRYAVYGLKPEGSFMEGRFLKGKLKAYAEAKGPRPDSAVIGPLPDTCGGLRVDRSGNIYVGMLMLPAEYKGPAALVEDPSWRSLVGSIAKFGPEGGEWISTNPRLAARAAPDIRKKVPEGAQGIWMENGHFLHGAKNVYTGFAPFSGSAGTSETGRPPMGRENCACRSPRFDLDRYDRLYIPNAVSGRVQILDNSGNEILTFGEYGNRDSAGPGSKVPVPAIPLAWPIGVGVGREHIYICDQLNRRVIRVDQTWATEVTIGPSGEAAAPAAPVTASTPAVSAAPAGAETLIIRGPFQAGKEYALLPRARVPLVANAPVLDGKLDEECWKQAVKLSAFKPNVGGPNQAEPQTEGFMASTREALYLGLRCHEKDLEGLIGKAQEYDWSDDAVEIFLLVGQSSDAPYFQFQVNAAGALRVGYQREELPEPYKFQVAAGREQEAWTLELAMPFSSLNLPKDEKLLATGCRFNIVRTRPPHKGDKKLGGALKRTAKGALFNEETAWSPTECESSHMPHMFGFLSLEVWGGK